MPLKTYWKKHKQILQIAVASKKKIYSTYQELD